MVETAYRDLAEFGLPFLTPAEPAFPFRFEAIRSLPRPFGPDIESVPERAAILENQSGKAVITLGFVWSYRSAEGEARMSSHLNLGSSKQMDVLTGCAEPARDLFSFILPGARRLITEDGMFGDNRDVLPPQSATGGVIGSSGGGRNRGGIIGRDGLEREVLKIDLELDIAIFENGLCVGPDRFDLRESLTEQIQVQQDTAREIVQLLRRGGTRGLAFEMLQPLARHGYPPPPSKSRRREGHRHTPVLSMFARSAVNRLMEGDDAELVRWFEAAAEISPLRLHGPSRSA